MVQSGPPDTSTYYHIAYLWAAVLYAAYALLLWTRGRQVRERLRDARARARAPRRDA